MNHFKNKQKNTRNKLQTTQTGYDITRSDHKHLVQTAQTRGSCARGRPMPDARADARDLVGRQLE